MKAVAAEQINPLGNSLMTEFTRVRGNRDLGGHAGSAYWDRILGEMMDILGGHGSSDCDVLFAYMTNNGGNESQTSSVYPTINQVGSLSVFMNSISRNGITSLEALVNFIGGGNASESDESDSDKNVGHSAIRYLYSKRWGWIDIKHFSNAAVWADNIFIGAGFVLRQGENLEKRQEKNETGSAWSFEDLPSNLLGVIFESYLESGNTNFEEKLSKFFTEIGVIDDYYNAPNFLDIPGYQMKTVPVPQNKTYAPQFTLASLNQPIDIFIQAALTVLRGGNIYTKRD